MKVILDVMTTMLTMKQQHREDPDDYLERHKAAKKLFLSHVGSDFAIDLFVRDDPKYKDIMKDVHDVIKASNKNALAIDHRSQDGATPVGYPGRVLHVFVSGTFRSDQVWILYDRPGQQVQLAQG